jgi:hypothetical protein
MTRIIKRLKRTISEEVSRHFSLYSTALALFLAGANPAFAQTSKPATSETGSLLNILTPREKAQGWRLLFNGSSTEEWTGAKGPGFPAKGWVIKDGMLTVLGAAGGDHASGGDIITKEQYGNFELFLEFQIPPGANSGIKYLVVNNFPQQPGNYLGPEYQIIDDDQHADAKLGVNGNRTLGSLYDLIPAQNKKANPVGQWNQVRIIVNGNHVEHWLNGSKVVEYERGSRDFRKLVAASKYKDLAGFGEMPKGHLLLQGHGDTVYYRNIKIRNLPAS